MRRAPLGRVHYHSEAMSRFACWLLPIAFVGGCGGGTPEDPGVPTDSGQDVAADSAVDTGTPDTDTPDTEVPDTGPEVRDTGPEILDCTSSQWEPNGTEGSASWIGEITDCDSAGSSFSGVLGGGSDVDWWHYAGSDKLGCSVDPWASTKSGVKLCMYVSCKGGPTEVKSCKTGTASKSPSGAPGCCSDSGGTVQIDFHCTLLGADDSADVFLKVSDPTVTTCRPYKVDYHY